jgi:hypothetical protein
MSSSASRHGIWTLNEVLKPLFVELKNRLPQGEPGFFGLLGKILKRS